MGITGPLPPHLADKIADPAERKRLGKMAWTAEETLAANAERQEKEDHALVAAWCRRNEIEFLHAPTWRKVKDLPPGWPDFTFIWGNAHYFVELKSAAGRLSPAQIAFKDQVERQGGQVSVFRSYEEVRSVVKNWLWNLARWTEKEPWTKHEIIRIA